MCGVTRKSTTVRMGARENPRSQTGNEAGPGFLRKHRCSDGVLASRYRSMNSGRPQPRVEQIENAIIYQLFERVVFVHPPDPIVGDLYTTPGDMDYTRFQEGQNARDFLTQRTRELPWALRYGTAHEDRVRALSTKSTPSSMPTTPVDEEENRTGADLRQRDSGNRPSKRGFSPALVGIRPAGRFDLRIHLVPHWRRRVRQDAAAA